MKIGIVTFSSRHKGDVNLVEAYQLAKKAREMGHEATVYQSRYFSFSFDQKESALYYKGRPFDKSKIDIAISRASIYKDVAERLSVLREFEIMGIPILNNYKSVLWAKNKFHTFQHLAAKGLPLIKTVLLSHSDYINFAVKKLGGFPLVVKAASGVEGKGVTIFESERSFRSGIELILKDEDRMDNILLQEYVEAGGIDYRVFVVGDKVVGQMKRSAKEGDFRANISQGGKGEKADLSDEVRQIAIDATKALGLDISGVDILLAKNGPLICEVNSSPGLKISRITSTDIEREIVKMAEKKCQNHAQKDNSKIK
ncbi:MAG: RimK family alpha-L-glutamate ligase [Candidatus Gracilibacteria bacterium]|jgi:ribosomal protein S6--L-glutamate ligase|nr:RimK family alpha-L-glutamate ligase [Candidatus Gracilibacteria bacterium]